ncbi:hypothetical protein E3N88_34819 [Mikania micrantha]|uniref:Uncharacterized protein n=1 Tax=Mikania micrantha TaxID=192012 RepID=A0A5N6LZ81_9ASTR|nr:hypothetical protein E3N88_34819 [Mikania micrantha]
MYMLSTCLLKLSDIVRQTDWPLRLDIGQALLVNRALLCQNHVRQTDWPPRLDSGFFHQNTDIASHIQFRYGWMLNSLGCSAVHNGNSQNLILKYYFVLVETHNQNT